MTYFRCCARLWGRFWPLLPSWHPRRPAPEAILGHTIIATVAYVHLAPAARERVDSTLRDETDTLTTPEIAQL